MKSAYLGTTESAIPLSGQNCLKADFNTSYSPLMQALCHYSPEWWKQCWSSDRGILKSDDPTLNQLLQPLESVIEICTCKFDQKDCVTESF